VLFPVKEEEEEEEAVGEERDNTSHLQGLTRKCCFGELIFDSG